MAIGDLLNEAADKYEILNSGIAFNNLDDIIGKGPPGTSCTSNAATFTSEEVLIRFDRSNLITFLATNSTLAYLTLTVEYNVTNDTADEYTVTANGGAYVQYEYATEQSVAIDTTYTKNADEGNKKTATFAYYIDNLISNSSIINDTFGFAFKFLCNNPSGSNVTIDIFTISINLRSATGGSYILFNDTSTGRFYDGNETADYSIIQLKSYVDTTIRVYNVGSQKLVINKNGVTLADSTDIQFITAPNSAEQELNANAYITVSLRLNGFTSGKSVNTYLQINSNAYNGASIYFIYTVSSLAAGILQIIYDNATIVANTTINLTTLPLDISTKKTIGLKNIGTSTLVIYQTSITGAGSKAEDCIVNNDTISVGQTKNFTFYADTNTFGNKSAIITLQASDSQNTNTNINVVYSVAEQTKFVLYESVTSNTLQAELTNDSLTDFGFVDRGRSLKKYYTITNSGVYKTLIVNSIISTIDDIVIGDLPTFPYTLQKNASNSFTFEVSFLTSTSGLKEGSLLIDYSEGAA